MSSLSNERFTQLKRDFQEKNIILISHQIIHLFTHPLLEELNNFRQITLKTKEKPQKINPKSLVYINQSSLITNHLKGLALRIETAENTKLVESVKSVLISTNPCLNIIEFSVFSVCSVAKIRLFFGQKRSLSKTKIKYFKNFYLL